MENRYNVCSFGAQPDGITDCTSAIQSALDAAGQSGGEVVIPSGAFLTGSLFVHSNTWLHLEEGSVLLGSSCEKDYPSRPSRIAGIEMDWPAGLLNVQDASHVRIYGSGTIDGRGEVWWEKYWGADGRGGMRAQYERQVLRWAVDYDCARPRNVVVFNSSDVVIEGVTLRRSGFWNLHLCYSQDVTVRQITICDNQGPSTDGIDVDSCCNVLVERCHISCNDDNICIKSGRDADGLRVARPCEHIVIWNNTLLEGEGITLGSETSGGIRHISIEDNTFCGTKNGFRLKSTQTRGGTVEDVDVKGMRLRNVGTVFCFDFDWHPAYSRCEIPEDYIGPVPSHWHTLLLPVPVEKGLPVARSVRIRDVQAEDCDAAMYICGQEGSPFEKFVFEDMSIHTRTLGKISNIRNLFFQRTEFSCGSGRESVE